MTNNYEYVQVDPKVIQMFGGSDDMFDPISGSFEDDLPPEVVNSCTPRSQQGVFQESMFPNFESNVNTNSTNNSEILKQILQELKEIKVILAGR